jgi:hypothetical protein
MPLCYVLDEQLRGPLWQAIQQNNKVSGYPIDVLRVGDVADLPLGSSDPDILLWAEREGRVIISYDKKTMLGYLSQHLQAGRHCAGLFLIRSPVTIAQIVDYLAISAYAADPAALRDRFEYIP